MTYGSRRRHIHDRYDGPLGDGYPKYVGVAWFCLLTIVPQIFEFIGRSGRNLGWGTGRGPAMVLISHATALVAGAPGGLGGSIGGDTKRASSNVLLALVYSYTLFAVAIITPLMTIGGNFPDDKK